MIETLFDVLDLAIELDMRGTSLPWPPRWATKRERSTFELTEDQIGRDLETRPGWTGRYFRQRDVIVVDRRYGRER